MSLEKFKNDFDFFKKEKGQKIKMSSYKAHFVISMLGISVVFLTTIGIVHSKFNQEQKNSTETIAAATIVENTKIIKENQSTLNSQMLSANKDNKEKELKKIAEELMKFEKKELKNDSKISIKRNGENKQGFIEVDKIPDKEMQKEMISYEKK